MGFSLGCAPSEQSPVGFRLPEGDLVKGKEAFVKLNCGSCHTVAGETDLMGPPEDAAISVELGGKVTRVKTYAHLVTSVIYPSHVMDPKWRAKYADVEGNSPMPDLTNVMTARELIDIVSFLQPKYEVVMPEYRYMEGAYGR